MGMSAREEYRCWPNSKDGLIRMSATQRTKLDVTSLHVSDPGPEASLISQVIAFECCQPGAEGGSQQILRVTGKPEVTEFY